jgi:anaerobic dimethyl sulfoxide reductase subunit C (anchor subunit)
VKERSLVLFTLLSQLSVGAFWVLGALYWWADARAGAAAAAALTDWGILLVAPLMVLGLLASFFHLGKPLNALRALSNLGSSWLSRESLFAALFAAASGFYTILRWLHLGSATLQAAVGAGAALLGLALLYCMARSYRLRTVPAWDTWVTPAAFFIGALLLGGLVAATVAVLNPAASTDLVEPALRWIGPGAAILLAIQLAIVPLWLSRLAGAGGAARTAAGRVTVQHARLLRWRLGLAIVALAAAAATPIPRLGGEPIGTTIIAFGLALVSELIGRLLFYEAHVREGV